MSRRQEKKVPIRTCLGCGKKAEKQHLARLAAVNGQIAVDNRSRMAGRGAYCCRQEKCFRNLMKKERKLGRALRCESLRWPDDRTSLMNNVIKN